MSSVFTIRGKSAHGELMDRLYRHQRHIYDLTRKYYLFGRDRLIAGLDVPRGGKVLEIGCGTGRNLVRAARCYPHAFFFGVDISREMLASAGTAARRAGVAPRRAGVAPRVRLAKGDAERFDACTRFAVPGFDRVVFAYALSMVPGWRAALAMALAHVAPGGSLHMVDFAEMDRWPRWARGLMRRWLKRFHVTPRAGLVDEAGRLARAHGLAMTVETIAGGYARIIVLTRPAPSQAVNETSDRGSTAPARHHARERP